jgi:hypothetical protein
MSGGGKKQARRNRNADRKRRQERRDTTVAQAWQRAATKKTPLDGLLAHFEEKAADAARAKIEAADDQIGALVESLPEKGTPDQAVALAKAVYEKAPKIVNRVHVLWRLANAKWLRPLEDWKPKGKGADTQFRSLVDHLLVEYRMPAFLYQMFNKVEGRWGEAARRRHRAPPQHPPNDRHIDLFIQVAQGASLYKVVKAGGLPTPMTKRMCHAFMQSSANSTLIEAVRRVQVEAFGGDLRLLHTLLSTRLGREFRPNEPFWATVIQWFCNHSMIDTAQVGPLMDYITHRRAEETDFSMKGRSPLAMLRGMEAWHGVLAHVRKLHGKPFEPSGFDAGRWEYKRRLPSGGSVPIVWTMTEILASKELATEGRAMKHCVYSYGRSIESGNTSIWSLQKDGERVLTVEVQNRQFAVVQARGKLNRSANPAQRRHLQHWADDNGLDVRRYC